MVGWSRLDARIQLQATQLLSKKVNEQNVHKWDCLQTNWTFVVLFSAEAMSLKSVVAWIQQQKV